MNAHILSYPLAALLACAAVTAAEPKPNLVLILADDLGYRDVGFNGCEDIPTPHIDSIASNGVRFSSGYVTYTVCSPSRAGMLTGRYQQRFGHERNPEWQPQNPQSGLPLGEDTLADTLGKVGYHSGVIGKWHLGSHPVMHPLSRGFQEFFGMLGGGSRYLPGSHTIKEPRMAKNEGDSYRLWMMRNHEPVQPKEYLTDEFSNEAVSFIGRNKDKPFFLYLAYNAPHAPLEATEKYLSRFPDIKNPRRRTYAAMVSAVDDGVGRVLAELRKQGLEDRTMVVFLSDNGGPIEANASNNDPLRAGKGSPFEGGWRVPFAIQWPQYLPKGKVYVRPVLSLDIFATMASVAEAPADPSRPLDGVNLVPYLNGQKPGDPHDAIYLRMFDKGAFAVRNGDHKLLITDPGAPPHLYNLATDLSESDDQAASKPEVLSKLETKRAAWNQQLVEPVFKGLKQSKGKAAE